MDICYYVDQMKDELDGSIAYIKRAIHCKTLHPEWAALYASMSEAELGHADNLVKIFEDDYKLETAKIAGETPEIYKAVYKDINDMYAEQTAKIKYMHEVYKNK